MKFTVERDLIFAALTKARAVIDSRSTIPILNNARIVAKDGKVAVRGSDLDNQIDTVIDADVTAPGGATVPCGLACDIAKSIPKRAVMTFELDEQKMVVTIKSGRAKINLSALPIEDYPDLEEGDFSHTFDLTREEIADIFERTQYAISSDETRHYLRGVYFHSAGEEVRGCATDGHRLALVCRNAPPSAVGFPGVIIPTKTVSTLLSLCAGVEDVEVSVSRTKVRFECGAAVLLSKVVDGTFPDYMRVIPQSNDRKMRIDRDAFVAAISRCVAVGSERGHLLRMDMSAEDGLILSAQSSESGSNAREEIDAEWEGAPLTIGFNARYLVSVADRFVDSDHLVMTFTDPGAPALVMSREDSLDRTVLMPMRVS